jgi:hypothetical protein
MHHNAQLGELEFEMIIREELKTRQVWSKD